MYARKIINPDLLTAHSEIWFENKVNEGSTIYFSLPFGNDNI